MYENTNITLDISLSTGEKRTLVFSRDNNNGLVTITLDGKPIDMINCHKYIGILNNFSKLLDNRMIRLMHL